MKINKTGNFLSFLWILIFMAASFLISSCKKVYIQPSLKSFANTDNTSLKFADAQGNVQVVSTNTTRKFHGTGPMSPSQENLITEYSSVIDGNRFKIDMDGDGPRHLQVMTCQVPERQQNGTYSYNAYTNGRNIYPIISSYMSTYVTEETQLNLHGRVYDHVLRFYIQDEFNNNTANNPEWFKEIFLAEGYGLVAYTTLDDTSYFLLN